MRSGRWYVGGYTAPLLAFFFTLLWVGLQFVLIGWRTPDWQFGTLPYVPGDSVFVTDFAPSIPQRGNQVELPAPTPGGTDAPR